MMFDEPGARELAERLESFDQLVASNLLEAEVRSAAAREGQRLAEDPFGGFEWILPEAALRQEIRVTLEAGYLTGADLWHVASALSIVEQPDELTFITLDERQRDVAAEMGFRT